MCEGFSSYRVGSALLDDTHYGFLATALVRHVLYLLLGKLGQFLLVNIHPEIASLSLTALCHVCRIYTLVNFHMPTQEEYRDSLTYRRCEWLKKCHGIRGMNHLRGIDPRVDERQDYWRAFGHRISDGYSQWGVARLLALLGPQPLGAGVLG